MACCNQIEASVTERNILKYQLLAQPNILTLDELTVVQHTAQKQYVGHKILIKYSIN